MQQQVWGEGGDGRYGTWVRGGEEQNIVEDFTRHLGGSAWFAVHMQYSDSDREVIVNGLSFGGSVWDFYSQGATLTDDMIGVFPASNKIAVSWASLTYFQFGKRLQHHCVGQIEHLSCWLSR